MEERVTDENTPALKNFKIGAKEFCEQSSIGSDDTKRLEERLRLKVTQT